MIKTVLCLMVPVVFQAGQAPASRQTPPRAAASRPAGVDLRVTDRTGATLADARVAAEGAVSRSGVTDASGLVTFRNLPAGTYRLHIEHDGYVALEKEMAVAAGSTITGQAALTAAPPPPAPARRRLLLLRRPRPQRRLWRPAIRGCCRFPISSTRSGWAAKGSRRARSAARARRRPG